MDDLISRAALLKDLSYCAPELWQDEEYIKAKIMKQPAVDAVPVEWMREKMRGYASSLKSTETAALVMVMQMWQKEQEAQGT